MAYGVGIGAEKAGTTWLAGYFYEHPEVFMAPYKEMHYFDSWHLLRHATDNWRRYLKRRTYNLAKYGPNNGISTPDQIRDLQNLYRGSCFRSDKAYRAFLDYGAAGKKLSAEITPTYTDLDAAGFRHMAKVLPGVKLILIVRNPIDRFVSQVRMDRSYGKARADWPLERILSHPHYRRRGDYRRTLLEAEKAVDPSRILLTFYERLFDPAHRERELRRICTFFDISYRPPGSEEPSNVARDKTFSLDADGRRYLAQHYEEVMRFMAKYDGGLPPSWQADLDRL